MKNEKLKIFLLALFVSALLISTVSARDGKIISSGDTIFTHEENLNLSALGISGVAGVENVVSSSNNTVPTDRRFFIDKATLQLPVTKTSNLQLKFGKAPYGISTYEVTVSVGNGVEIIDAYIPSGISGSATISTDKKTVTFSGTDSNTIGNDSTDILLGVFTVSGVSTGSSMTTITKVSLVNDLSADIIIDGAPRECGITVIPRYSVEPVTPQPVTKIAYYDKFDGGAGTPTKIITLGSDATLTVSEISIEDKYGIWYAWTDSGLITPNRYVNIQKPRLQSDIYLNNRVDKVSSGTVTTSSKIVVRVESNVPPAFIGNVAKTPAIQITVKTSEGGEFTNFGNCDLSAFNMAGKDIGWTCDMDLANVKTGSYYVIVKWKEGTDFYAKGVDATTKSFTIISKDLTLTTSRDNVTIGDAFTLTISGKSNQAYYFYIQSPPTNSITVTQGLVGVTSPVVPTETSKGTATTDSSGKRIVEFRTDGAEDKTYTIKVIDASDNQISDSITIRVKKGEIVASVKDSPPYFIGQDIKLYGTNTQSEKVYLFITGPNLGSGRNLATVTQLAITGNENTFAKATVKSDDTWEYTWHTSTIGMTLDPGTYTIYAVATPNARGDLTDVVYDIISIPIGKATITCDISKSVARGDTLKISGKASGEPESLYIWIFGKNYREVLGVPISVEDDGSYEYTVEGSDSLTSGQYYVIVQHPMYNNEQDVYAEGTFIKNRISGNRIADIGGLMAPDAAMALINAIESSAIDDMYASTTFFIEEAIVRINAIQDRSIGGNLTISGTTNYQPGNKVLIEVRSASFNPTKKTQTEEFSGASCTAEVVKGGTGDALNSFSCTIGTDGFKPDLYIVTAEILDSGYSGSTLFRMTEVPPPPPPTPTPPPPTPTPPPPTPTEVPVTPPETPPPTPTPTPIPTTTKSPGFGILIALVGLCGVALLVLRKER